MMKYIPLTQRFELQRFDIGGKVTDLDFTIAKGIEQKYSKRK